MNALLFFGVCLLCAVNGFVHTPSSSTSKITSSSSSHAPPSITSSFITPCNALPPGDEIEPEPIAVTINSTLSDTNTKKLFAWIKCAFDQTDKDDVYAYYYNNIELAIAAAFGDNLPSNSLPAKLLDMAMKQEGLLVDENTNEEDEDKEWVELLVGDPIGRRDRESASLGAMGAAQWTGQWMTRPHCKCLFFCVFILLKIRCTFHTLKLFIHKHTNLYSILPALLDVRNFTSVDDWIKTLPRGCKRTLKKATTDAQNFTVITKYIRGGHAAPHSSYAHFRCVVQHEVRLISNRYGQSTNAFVNALAEAISRYMGTTRMAGSIREYRDADTDKVIGFAHEVAKGRTMRGQWFYCDDDAAKRYVWFHSVRDLVSRAIEDDRIDVVDLGPSGSDAFTELKEKYGFKSVVDWPRAADYTSTGFIYEDDQNEVETMGDDMIRMIESLMERQQAREARRKDTE